MAYSIAVFFFHFFADGLTQELKGPILRLAGRNSIRSHLQLAHAGLERLRVQLETGLSPEPQDWTRPFETLPLWRESIPPLLQKLRSGGLPVLPTLQRLSFLLREEMDGWRKSQTQSAQARFQAGVSLVLVPLLGFLLSQILEAPAQNLKLWILVVALASSLGMIAAIWIDALTRRATRHGLSESDQVLPSAASLASEQFLAELRSGLPPDLAWSSMLKTAENWHPKFREYWSPLAVASEESAASSKRHPSVTQLLQRFSKSVQEAVKASLFEGRPCGERVETLANELRKDFEALRQRELELLPAKALQPLFICVAPAVLGILGSALALEASGSWSAWT